jgi:hypothetical protein
VWAIAGSAIAVVVAVVLVVVTSGSDRPNQRRSPPVAAGVGLIAGPLGVKTPRGFESLDQPVAVPGLRLKPASSAALGGRPAAGAVTVGLAGIDANTPLLLPDRFVATLGLAAGEAPRRQAVAVGPGRWRAYRFAAVTPAGFRRNVRLYTWPTSAGVAVVACLAPIPAAQCDTAAASLTARDTFAFPLGPDGQYARAVDNAFEQLNRTLQRSRGDWRNARRQATQATSARSISSAFSSAAAALGKLRLSPADRTANSGVAGSMRAAASTYGQLAAAAKGGNRASYKRAARMSARADQALERALSQLRAQGYKRLITARFQTWTIPALRPITSKPSSEVPSQPAPPSPPDPSPSPDKPHVIPPILPEAAPKPEKPKPIKPVGPT